MRILLALSLLMITFPVMSQTIQKPKSEIKKPFKTKKNRIRRYYALLYIYKEDKKVGIVKIKLFHKRAPKTVENFIGLAEGKITVTQADGSKVKKPFYNGLTFHRVIKNFVVQTGCPIGDGTGGPGYKIEDEFHPDLTHSKAGIISMANEGAPDTNGSQFFITLSSQSSLNNQHSVFGEVISGLNIIRKISYSKTNRVDKPKKNIILKKVKIIREYYR